MILCHHAAIGYSILHILALTPGYGGGRELPVYVHQCRLVFCSLQVYLYLNVVIHNGCKVFARVAKQVHLVRFWPDHFPSRFKILFS